MLVCRVMLINPSNSEMPQVGVRLMSNPVVFSAGFIETMPEIPGLATLNTLKEHTSEGVRSWASCPLDRHLNDVFEAGARWRAIHQWPGKVCCAYDEQQRNSQGDPVSQGVFGGGTFWSDQ